MTRLHNSSPARGGDLHPRPATAADRDRVYAMMADFYREEGYPFAGESARSALAGLLADASLGRIWIAEIDGEPAGYLALTLGYSLEHGGRDAFVDELFVRPSYRRRGIGSRLLTLAIEACGELGVRALHLEVERTNEPGQSLYRRHGFVDNDRRLLTRRVAER